MRISRRTIYTCLALYFFSLILFLINIQFPRGHDFDEFHYVPSAKQFLQLKENQNWEHPPLGKEIMAAGIAIGEDRPFGWRLMSTIFGSLTLVAVYLWTLALFRSPSLALWTAALTLANNLLYVQSRIGMLDTFMFAFIMWGVLAFTLAWDTQVDSRRVRRLLIFAGVMFGLGTACKWFGLMPWLGCIGMVCLVRLLQSWKVAFGDGTSEDWYQPTLWNGISVWTFILALGVVPVVSYFVTFIPYLFIHGPSDYNLWGFITMQKKMYEGQLRVVNSHPYMSHWWDWPTLRRPIWYAFDKEGDDVRGVLLLGNPLIMWSGLGAVAACIWGWLVERRRDAFMIAFFYLVFFGSWVAIPRKVSFYYYYYPAGMMLAPALAYVFYHAERTGMSHKVQALRAAFLGASIGLFAYFFPILAALRIPSESFRRWMWFRTWI